jgi:hypothetical protein
MEKSGWKRQKQTAGLCQMGIWVVNFFVNDCIGREKRPLYGIK